jgi:hypothetical protein
MNLSWRLSASGLPRTLLIARIVACAPGPQRVGQLARNQQTDACHGKRKPWPPPQWRSPLRGGKEPPRSSDADREATGIRPPGNQLNESRRQRERKKKVLGLEGPQPLVPADENLTRHERNDERK